ncbi:uncharacterized protein LOC142166987 [Nicotiana tabacum]|uniref:Uncharacterized protein LOC142166987 n=1 Tax=Nicotiana tabacum TaxID=4097 RepID=A0AC58SE37_TOBAC
MASVKSPFNINVIHSKCKRAKRMILEKMEDSFADAYNKLEGYANELRSSNLGTDVVINISNDALSEGKRRFLRMYICFHALKMGFKSGLRPFIGLDGTFLKRKCKGQLLVVVAQDSMRHFYPLAWVIVDKETKVTWSWFLRLLQHSLNLKIGEEVTFILDMQKNLIDSAQLVLLEAHHRYCVRHIEANWCKRWGGGEYNKYLWWAVWGIYEEYFKDQLRNMGEVDEYMDNNLIESFNSWIKESRFKPIIKIFEGIRVKAINMLREHESTVMSWSNDFSPQTMQLYSQYLNIENKCHVHYNGQEGYEASEDGDKHTVNMVVKRCTCRTWDLNGITCPHAIKAIQYNKMNPLTEIHRWYTKEAYFLAYSHKLQPVKGEIFWKVEASHAMEPPKFVKMVGRPKVKRTREKNETVNKEGEWM